MTTRRMEFEVYGQDVNAAVIKMPSRKYPGILVQGDSLHNMLTLIKAAEAALAAGNSEEAKDVLQEVREVISGYEVAYTNALAEHRVPPPF